MIVEHPLIGVGLGQFVPRMQEFFSSKLLDWQYQPVHNVFLLVWSEVGIIGLFGLFQILRTIWKGQKMFHMKQNSSKNTSQSEVSEIGTDIYGEDVSRLPRQMFPVEHSDWGGTVNVNLATYIKAVLVGFTFIALFDHYLWDIQQGQIMLWLTLGLLLGVEHSEDTIDKS